MVRLIVEADAVARRAACVEIAGDTGKPAACTVKYWACRRARSCSVDAVDRRPAMPPAHDLPIRAVCRRNGPRMLHVARRRASPRQITFKTKPQIALDQIRAACAAGVARGVVLMDAAYGCHSALRHGVSALALRYVAAIAWTIKVQAVDRWRQARAAHERQGAGARPAQARLAHDHMARTAPTSGCPRALPACACGTSPIRRAKRAGRGDAADRVAGRRGQAQPILARPPCLRVSPSAVWSTSPRCAGASSAITRSSSRKSGSGTTRGADGQASIITARCASPPTAS